MPPEQNEFEKELDGIVESLQDRDAAPPASPSPAHRRTNPLRYVALPLVVVVVYLLVLRAHQRHKAEQLQALAVTNEKLQWENSVSALANKYGAITNWTSDIPADVDKVFSLHVSHALLRTNGKPVLLRLELQDVFEKAGTNFAGFSAEPLPLLFDLSVQLRLSPEQAQTLLTQGGKPLQECAVVANILQIARAEPSMATESTKPLDEAYPTFVAKGDCLEILLRHAAVPEVKQQK